MKAYWQSPVLVATALVVAAVVGCDSEITSPPPPNNPPVANAGAAQEVEGGDTVLLDGSGSSDPDGDSLSYHWRQVAGTVVALGDSLAVQTTFTAPPTSEILTFRLSVTDGGGLGDTDQTIVTVFGDGTPPVANAGADQTVQVAQAVVLNGSGYDPDGGPVTLAWTQYEGPNVVLSDPASPRPTFTPSLPSVLRFELAVTDTSNVTTRDSTAVTVQVNPAPLVPTLWVVGSEDEVQGWANPGTVGGNAVPDRLIRGASTRIDGPTDLVTDVRGALYVSNLGSPRITAWDPVNQLGDAAPDRVVEGAATGLRTPQALAIGPLRDLLFVCDEELRAVGVWGGVSEPDFDGDRPPTRAFWPGPLVLDPIAASYDEERDILFVANRGEVTRGLIVFYFASATSGRTGRWIANVHESMSDISDVFLDRRNDRLFVTNGGTRSILVFDDAAGIAPQQPPDRVITIGDDPQAVVVDAQDRGYVADLTNRIYRIDDIGTKSGAVSPDGTIEGADTRLQAPRQLFLTE